ADGVESDLAVRVPGRQPDRTTDDPGSRLHDCQDVLRCSDGGVILPGHPLKARERTHQIWKPIQYMKGAIRQHFATKDERTRKSDGDREAGSENSLNGLILYRRH